MQKPASLTVFGVLNVIFGVLGLCGAVFNILGLAAGSARDNPILYVMKESAVFLVWNWLNALISPLLLLVLLASGVGLLMAKSWGRLAAMGVAGAYIVMDLLSTLMSGIFLLPLYLELLDKSGERFMLGAAGAAGLGLGACFGLVYPVLVLIFMTRKPVVDFFRGA